MVTNGMIGLFFIAKLFCLISVKGEYYIENHISQLTLTSGANITIKCIGSNIPITWERDTSLLTQKNYSINSTSERNIHYNSYESLLHLKEVSIKDIGYYYCGPKSANVSKNKDNFTNIYIFVQDDKHLLTHSVNELYQNEFGDVIIPCRPTSPDIDVTLKKDGELITENIHYDAKIGYTHWFFWNDTFKNYVCVANTNNSNEIRQFTIYKNPNATKIIINEESLDRGLITGQNVTLVCTVHTYLDENFTIEWDLPKNLTMASDARVGIDDLSKSTTHHTIGTKTLVIQNITSGNYDEFVCRVKMDSGRENLVAYTPSKIVSHENFYLELKILSGSEKIICRPGSEVQWVIQVLTKPTVKVKNIIWYDNVHYQQLKEQPDKYTVETINNNTSSLIIRNVQPTDPKVYTLCAYTDSVKKEIDVFLEVEVKPSIQFPEYFNLSTIYYGPNNVQPLDIHIIGYPLPKVRWRFQSYLRNCSIESCSKEHVIVKDTVVSSERELCLIIGINITVNGTLSIDASNYLGNATQKYEIVLTDLEILPDTPEYSLSPDSPIENRVLVCKGNVPVQWHFKQYDETLIKKTNFSRKMSTKDGATQSYLSILPLGKANYLDTGYYFCSPSIADKKLITQFKKIYVFVEDAAHLFAVPLDINTWFINGNYSKYIIPCRPTSQDIVVTIKTENTEKIYDEMFYDNKVGYVITFLNSLTPYVYVCEATKNNKREKLRFTNVQWNAYIVRNDGNSNVIFDGQNISLSCSEIIPTNFHLRWITPDQLTHKISRVSHRINFHHQESISLNILNVTVEDRGEIICELRDTFFTYNISYSLNIIKPDTPFLNLTILQGQSVTIRPAGFGRVQWTIQISSNPRAFFEWKDQYGNKLEKFSKKINVQNGNNISVLAINDLQLLDSGVYKLIADNGNCTEEISVTLFVEDKPSIRPLETSYSNVLYDVGKVADFEFYILGYPLPIVEWSFKKCSTYPSCTDVPTRMPVTKNVTTKITDTKIKLSISIQITETGTLICSAENKFEISIERYTILSTDIPGGFSVSGPQIIFAGDTVTLDCGVSKYYYRNNSNNWSYPNDISNHTGLEFKNETLFSYHSYLTIKNISTKFNGYVFECNAKRKIQTNEGLPESLTLSIKLEDPSKPILITKQLKLHMLCLVKDTPTPNISWSKDNHPLLLNKRGYAFKNNSQILQIHDFKPEDEGTYMCKATNKMGSTVSTYYYTTQHGSHGNYHQLIIIIFLVLSMSVAIFVIIIMYLKITKTIQKKIALCDEINMQNSIIGAIQNSRSNLRVEKQVDLLPYDRRLEFPSNKLKLGKTLSLGEFRIVYKAKAIDLIGENTIISVAVKTVKENVDLYHTNALIFELRTLMELGDHLNIVKFFGACTGCIDNRLMVIEEYCRFGNVHQYLRKHRDNFVDRLKKEDCIIHEFKPLSNAKPSSNGHSSASKVKSETCSNYYCGDDKNANTNPLSTDDLIYWSYNILKGMEYLAKMHVVHRNLAAKNILLAKGNVVKICNFRLAKITNGREYHKEESDKDNLPFKWMAIECIHDRVYSTQSDVWAFGVVMWELFSLAASPYSSVQIRDLSSLLVDGYRMEKPELANSEIYKMMLDCWKAEPMKRPSVTELVERMRGQLPQDYEEIRDIGLNDHYERVFDEIRPANHLDDTSSTNDSSEWSITSKFRWESQNNVYENLENHYDELELKSVDGDSDE